jgi:hypothetical protein
LAHWWWFDSIQRLFRKGVFWNSNRMFQTPTDRSNFVVTVKGVGKYKLYLSRQRNIRVDPFGDKEN